MGFASSYRKGRAKAMLVGVVIFAGMMMLIPEGPELVSHHTVTAILEESHGSSGEYLKLRLEDGRVARVVLPHHVGAHPRIGEEVPLVMYVYDDGSEYPVFDHDAWLQ